MIPPNLILTNLSISVLLALVILTTVSLTPRIHRRDKWLFAGYLIGAFLWNGSLLATFLVSKAGTIYQFGDVPYTLIQILYIGAPAFVFFFPYLFFQYYKNPKKSWSLWEALALLLFLTLIVLAVTKDGLMISFEIYPEHYLLPLERNSSGVLFITLYVLFFYFSSLWTLCRRIRNEKNAVYKKQFQYMLYSYFTFITLGVTTNWILSAYLSLPQLNGLGPSFWILEACVFFYAVTKLRFLDLQLTAQKYCTYITNTALYGLPFVFLVRSVIPFDAWSQVTLYGIYALFVILSWKQTLQGFHQFWNYVFYRQKQNPVERIKETAQAFQKSIANGLDMLSQSLSVKKATFATPEQVGTHLSQFFSAYPDTELVREEVALGMAGGQKNGVMKKVKTEMEKYMIAAAFPVMDENRKLLGVILLQQKIDGRSFSVQEIQETKRMLQKATVYLAKERDYAQIQERLKNEYRVPKEFLTNLMHEVSHPLMIARNIDQMIEWQRLKPEDQQFIQASQEDLQELSRKLDRITYAFQWHAEMLSVQKSISLLEDSIRFAMDDLQEDFPEIKKWVTIHIDKKLKGKTYFFDSYLLKEAFREIIHNAVFFQCTKRKRLEIEVRQEGGTVMVDLRDYGIGIAKEHWEEIFQLMHVLSFSRNEAECGIGVGLTIARGIIEGHGGTIRVLESTSSNGTTFRIELPLEKVQV